MPYSMNEANATYLSDMWWTPKSAARPAPVARPFGDLPNPTAGVFSKADKPKSLKERFFGGKVQQRSEIVVVVGVTHQNIDLISLDDAQSRPVIRLHSIQHLVPELPMDDFPGCKLISLAEAGANSNVKYRTVL